MLSTEQIDHNVARQRAQLERFLHFDGSNAARVRNNADWLRPFDYRFRMSAATITGHSRPACVENAESVRFPTPSTDTPDPKHR